MDPSLIYALDTFESTEDGQVTIHTDDALYLLNDDHYYWWYVQIVDTDEMGYVPAELVELPNERLARKNKEFNLTMLNSQQEWDSQQEQDMPRRKSSVKFSEYDTEWDDAGSETDVLIENELPELTSDGSIDSSEDSEELISTDTGEITSSNERLAALNIDSRLLPCILQNLSQVENIQQKINQLVQLQFAQQLHGSP